MSVISGLQNLSSFLSIRRRPDAFQPQASNNRAQINGEADLLRSRKQLLQIYRALESVADSLNVRTRNRLDLADAASASPLGLDLTETAAFLTSTGEINASTTSYSPFGPDWIGTSTAPLTIGGEYDGSNGTGELTFEVRRPGVVGVNDVRLRVYDPQGTNIRTLNIRSSDDPNQVYDIRNGLFLRLGAGLLTNRDTATIQVNQNTGSVFDPSRPLAGIRNENPNFQYYPSPNTLPEIVDGSFEINGENIAVNAADSLNDVVTRINQSVAGVSASFNTTTERLELAQNTPGADANITIGGDTSNLLLAAKLDTATTVAGVDPDTARILGSVAAFSSIQAGAVRINDESIAIDPAVDTLAGVLERINSSDANVRATFNESTQRILIESTRQEDRLTLDGNGTGLFAALNVPEGRVDPVNRGRGVSRRHSYDVANAVQDLARSLNELFNDKTFREAGTYAGAARTALAQALGSAFAGAATPGSRYGLRFDTSAESLSRGRAASVERRTLTTSLQKRGDEVKDVLVGGGGGEGLIGKLLVATRQALSDVNTRLGRSGSVIDTYA